VLSLAQESGDAATIAAVGTALDQLP
jgi:hypothetical protein